jgi:hypothetical protein
MLPLARFREFENDGIIGRFASTCYSYYGYQLDPTVLLEKTMPGVAAKMMCCRSVGLVARFLEEQGFSTVALTMTPDFHREIGFPRVAAIEYP